MLNHLKSLKEFLMWSCPWFWFTAKLVHKISSLDLITPHLQNTMVDATKRKSKICRWRTILLNIYDISATQSYFPYLWGYRGKGKHSYKVQVEFKQDLTSRLQRNPSQKEPEVSSGGSDKSSAVKIPALFSNILCSCSLTSLVWGALP